MRFLHMVGALELCYSTFGKRAAPGSDKPCLKRPASAAADPVTESGGQWDAKDHDSYLRGLLADNPAVTEAGIMVAILRDHGVIIARHSPGYFGLRNHIKSLRSMPLTRAQLSEFYTGCVQEQRRAGKEGRALHKWFLQTTAMTCPLNTFKRWAADLPSPAMSANTTAPDCLGEAAFLDRDDTVWEVYMANPFVDAPAMTDLLEPRIGKVHTPMVEMWLDRTRSTQLELTCCLSS